MSKLTPYQETMLATWQQHGMAEFALKDPDAAIATMVEHPYILALGFGRLYWDRQGVYNFYKYDFLPNIPPDMGMEVVNRVVGEDRIIDEFVVRFTHTVEMPWKLPGVKPTGRKVEMAMFVLVCFKGDKIAYEHLMWNHAAVLAQVGVIDHPSAVSAAPSAAELLRLTRTDRTDGHPKA